MRKEFKEIVEKSKEFGWILEYDAKKILKEFNIQVPENFLVKSEDELEKIKYSIDFPVVMKVISPEILHKSDVGGVKVNITSYEELKKEFLKLINLKGAIGVIIEKMVKGVEIIVGAKNDYQFGPVIIVGAGGIGVEIFNDTAIRMAPVKIDDVFKMLEQLKIFPILKGYRGKKGVNINRLAELITKFSEFIMEFENFFETIDLNPVICNENSALVCDARIILKK